MKRLKIGLIGAGGIAEDVHLPAYQAISTQVEVVAIADVAYDRAKRLAKQSDVPHAFDSYERMLKEVELDAISVCVPNKFHKDAVIAGLEAGCHVLCEKPPAMNQQEAKSMEAAAHKAGKLLMYGFHYRFQSETQVAKRFIDAGEFGDIYAARVQALRRRGIPGWGVFTNKDLQGGGPLIDIGVHMLDTALYLMGYPEPKMVLGQTHQQLGTRRGVGLLGDWDYENFSVEDMAVGMVTFTNGASLVLETAFAANIESKETMQVSLMGNQGGADLFPLKMYQEKFETLIDVTPAYLPEVNAHQKEIHTFIQNCMTGHITDANANQGTIVQTIIDGLYQSAESGEAIKL
ncbi:oxidoreductase domain-containing protein [Gracilibacillus halophilus YIM-C55.5]|uniref:Oxidoreductase domain-containing protein n=1 Tax=Gracilibacillus halophilus YIM-C55.5 TaxID=1308866 RepID=N4WAY7_9BACI|nr:Gfo/Idh/MocA family oxidoreductase [Gracilibacillus halophilus]ENH96424.1 oxidoreductase domain-containing protein [Gracilibacillus halophilus YIM-C55.5]